MTVEEALKIVKAAGYRVSKPKEKARPQVGKLNAIGRPYSSQYDPNYKMKYQSLVGLTARLCKPMPKNTPYIRTSLQAVARQGEPGSSPPA